MGTGTGWSGQARRLFVGVVPAVWRARRSERRTVTAVLAATILVGGLGITLLGATPAAAAGPGTTRYAYPNGTAPTGSGCAGTSTELVDECSLGGALAVAASGDTVVLEVDPTTPDAPFDAAAVGGWTVTTSGLTMESAPGVHAILTGNDVLAQSQYVLQFAGSGTLAVSGVTVEGTTTTNGGGVVSGGIAN
ncbi:MAG: hypothetical protein ACRDTS_24910, partial [Mycobacterium sp.]